MGYTIEKDLNAHITDAQHRIEQLWNDSGGKCYLSFSGGKDSTVVLWLIMLCQELGTVGDIPAVFSNTGIEMKVTVDFVNYIKQSYYPNVVVIRPEKSFSWVLDHYGKPMKSKMKSELMERWQKGHITDYLYSSLIYGITPKGKQSRAKIANKDLHMLHPNFGIKVSNKCCKILKKDALRKFEKENSMLGSFQGIRTAEGGARSSAAKRREIGGGKLCTWQKDGVVYNAPIIDWSNDDIDQFISKYQVPLSDAYTKYNLKRTGCMACPFAINVSDDLKYLFHHEPNNYKAAMFWLKDVYIAQNVSLPFDLGYERERERESLEGNV